MSENVDPFQINFEYTVFQMYVLNMLVKQEVFSSNLSQDTIYPEVPLGFLHFLKVDDKMVTELGMVASFWILSNPLFINHIIQHYIVRY
jgi:hypothetical protein